MRWAKDRLAGVRSYEIKKGERKKREKRQNEKLLKQKHEIAIKTLPRGLSKKKPKKEVAHIIPDKKKFVKPSIKSLSPIVYKCRREGLSRVTRKQVREKRIGKVVRE